jgi:TonB-linked SusC/RagA family outer membrane protein
MRKFKTITTRFCRFLPAVVMLVSQSVTAQDVYTYASNKISKNKTHIDRGVQDTNDKQTLITVLKTLNRQKGVFFLYSEGTISQKLVNPVKNIQEDIEKILQDVLKNTGLKHKKVSDNTFVILNSGEKSKNNADYVPVEFPGNDLQVSVIQFVPVTGKITDKDGNPLAGVSVTVKGTNKGTSTNARGEFSIDADKGEIIVVSYVGYGTEEYKVGDDRSVSISLGLANLQMNEVVVTALGIRKESRRLGYSVTKVAGEEFTKSREINIGNALVGKVAGVNSSSPLTGPGGSSRVTIRGNSSLSFDNQPLYVINGIPMNNDNLGSAGKWGGSDFGDGVSSINPDDIEDITVLKGGSAAALYGQRGRNGVILITTKSGKGKKALGIELNSNVMIDKINDFTDYQDSYGQGFQNAKPNSQASALNSGLYSWGAKLDGSNVTLFDGLQHPYSAVSGDNLDEFYETGSTFTNTLAISGGSGDATTFRMSFGNLRNSSVYPNSKYNRTNVNLDLGYKLSEKWTGQANISYIKEVGKNRSNLSDAPGNGNFAILFLPPNVKAGYLSPGYNATGNETQFNDNAYNTNPYFAAAKFQNNTSRDRILGMASLRYSPVKWLYVQGRVANDFFSFDASSVTPTGTAYKPSGTINLERSYDYNETNADVLVGINRNITKELTIGVTAGGNILKMKSRVLDVNADGLAFPFLYNPGTASSRNANLSTPEKEVQSVYGSVELAYRNTFFLNITDRNDWSSTLPDGKNSYNYPSFNASYILTEQLKLPWLSYAKLRAGYAMVGGDAPIFATSLYYNTSGAINSNPIGNLSNEIPNKALEPLKVTEFEIGTEMKFLKNRLFVDFAWYNKQTLNDIVSATVSVTSGYTSALVNVGKLENKGIELLVGGTPVKTNNFTWTSSFNFADNKNKVVRLAEGQTAMQVPNGESRTERGFIQHIVGMPFSQVMVYDVSRDSKGLPKLGANGLQAADVLVSKGTGVHPITGGFNNDFVYKNFGLSFLIDYKSGAVLYSGTNATALQRGLHKETLNGRETGIVVSGVNGSGNPATQTVAAQNYYNELYRISAMQVYDADFIKFRSLSLTYNIPAKALRSKKIEGLSLSLVGRNLFYIKKNTPNIDPEANYQNGNAQGLEYAGLPSVRSMGFNLNVKF